MSDTTSAYQALIDQAKAGYPESWIPEKEGEALAGKFLRIEMGWSEYGRAPIAIVESEDGKERSVWLFHEALRSQFATAAPQPGDSVAVLYLGKQKPKTHTPGKAKEYHNYRVVKEAGEGRDNRVDWDVFTSLGSVVTPAASANGDTSESADSDDIPY